MNNDDYDFDKELGFRLKTIRQMRRMSQQHLGDMLGITFQQVQKYEAGTNRMPPERIDTCAKLFGIPVGYFFGRENDKGVHFDKRVMTIAAAIAALPSDDIAKKMYHLVLAINGNCTADKVEEKAA